MRSALKSEVSDIVTPQELDYGDPGPIVDALDPDVIDDAFNELDAPAASAVIRSLVLCVFVAQAQAAVGYGDRNGVAVEGKLLVDPPVRAEAVLGGVDTRLDDRRLDLVYRFRRKFIPPGDLL